MDENFFFKAMRAVGIRTVMVDETTDWRMLMRAATVPITEIKEPTMADDIQILSKNYYRALDDYPCSWGDDNHSIKKGRRYVRVVVKPDGAPLQTQKVCLDCWIKS